MAAEGMAAEGMAAEAFMEGAASTAAEGFTGAASTAVEGFTGVDSPAAVSEGSPAAVFGAATEE